MPTQEVQYSGVQGGDSESMAETTGQIHDGPFSTHHHESGQY